MEISLTNKSAFWTLMEGNKLIVHLTFKDPGPKTIDYAKLPKKLQKIVDQGLKRGNITQEQEVSS
jgi:hypothetical protein